MICHHRHRHRHGRLFLRGFLIRLATLSCTMSPILAIQSAAMPTSTSTRRWVKETQNNRLSIMSKKARTNSNRQLLKTPRDRYWISLHVVSQLWFPWCVISVLLLVVSLPRTHASCSIHWLVFSQAALVRYYQENKLPMSDNCFGNPHSAF